MTTHAEHKEDHAPHSDAVATYGAVFAVLLILLVITVWVAFHHFGVFNPIIAVTIAMIKTALVIWFFMHVRHGTHLTWVFAGAGFFFLGIMVVFVMSDVLSRHWMDLTETETLPRPFEELMQENPAFSGIPAAPAEPTPSASVPRIGAPEGAPGVTPAP